MPGLSGALQAVCLVSLLLPLRTHRSHGLWSLSLSSTFLSRDEREGNSVSRRILDWSVKHSGSLIHLSLFSTCQFLFVSSFYMPKWGWKLASPGLFAISVSPGLLKVLLHELETGYAGVFNSIRNLSWMGGRHTTLFL